MKKLLRISSVESNISLNLLNENLTDNNEDWIEAQILINNNSFKGNYVAMFQIVDFKRFFLALKNLLCNHCDKAIFSCNEDWLSLVIKRIDSLGHYSIDAIAKSDKAVLSLAFETDQFVVRKLTADIENIFGEL